MSDDPILRSADEEVQEWIGEMARAEARQGPGPDLTLAPAASRAAVELMRIRIEMTAIRRALQAIAAK